MVNKTRAATKLRIIAWNANSLTDKRDELEEFAHRLRADVMLISETFLKPQSWEPNIRNYKLYRMDRDGVRGGTAVYVRCTIDHSEVDTPTLQILEGCSVIVNTEKHGPIRIVSVYNPPNKKLLPEDLDALLKEDNLPLILAGDLNAKHLAWYSRVNNASGRSLLKFATEHHLAVIGPEEPTHFHRAGHPPDLLDIAVVRGYNHNINVSTTNDLSSDHNPIIIDLHNDEKGSTPTTSTTNWEVFTSLLNDEFGNLPIINTTQELDEAVAVLTTKVQRAIHKASRPKPTAAANRPKLPAQILEIIKNRQAARRTWHRTHDPADKTMYNRLTTELRDELRAHKNECWKEALTAADEHAVKYWHLCKALRKKRAPAK